MQSNHAISVENAVIDAVDREIIGHLVGNARLSFRELGERVSLSPNAAAERVRRLRERGVITGFTTRVDPSAAGRTLIALMDVRLDSPAESSRFERVIESADEITDAMHVTGRFDYQLRVACTDPGHLDQVIRLLKTKGGVIETDTRLALRTLVDRPGPLPA
jgi:Lrp/AsnC family transcriptional regulator, leucine-responsive regulatory protein